MIDTKTESITFRTTKEIKSFLERISKKHDRSYSYIINDLLGYFVDNPPKSIPFRKKK